MAARADTDRGADTRCLREVILDHLGKLAGKTSSQIYSRVQNDFGECQRRRFDRQLAWLITVGCVRKEDDRHPETGLHQARYFLVHRNVPDVRSAFEKQQCPLCGMRRTTRRTHPEHKRARRRVQQEMRNGTDDAPGPQSYPSDRVAASASA